MIPFVDLRLQYESIQSEIDHAIKEVFVHAQFVGGESVKKFEQQFCKVLDIAHCVGTGNGTDSLFLILKALGIGPRDEVITPAFSCIPSAECITLTGAVPVFADVDSQFYVIDPKEVEKKITKKTKAVIAVHLYGQAAPVTELKALCDRHNIFLIEDCAQAHLTKEQNKFAGTIGTAAAFSFYPTKNLGAYGDAGCVVTSDNILAEKVRRLANHGALKRDDHEFEGTNSRLDALQATVLSVKLKYLSAWNQQRQDIANAYQSLLGNIADIQPPAVRKNSTHTFHIYAIRTKQRDDLKRYLLNQGIETLIHYPQAVPFLKAYHHRNYVSADFPVAAMLQNEVLSLPVFPGLKAAQTSIVAENVKNYFLR